MNIINFKSLLSLSHTQSKSIEGSKSPDNPILLTSKISSTNTLCRPLSDESQCFQTLSGYQRASMCCTYRIHALNSESGPHQVRSLLRCLQGSKWSHRTNTKCDGYLANLLTHHLLLSYRARNRCEPHLVPVSTTFIYLNFKTQ